MTEPVPHMAISASPDMPEDVANLIREALINANKTEQGNKMPAELKVDYFEAADNSVYQGYGKLIKDTYGY